MHIAIDATSWQNKRGYGRYVRSLLRALVACDRANRYTFVMDAAAGDEPLPDGAGVRLVTSSAPTTLAASSNGHRSLRDMARVSRALADPAFDLILFPTIYSYVPVWSRARKVVMIMDVIAERYPRLALGGPTARLLWKIKVALGRRQADALLTLSDYSRRGIVAHFGVPPAQIFVVGAASDPVFRLLDAPRLPPRLAALGLAPGQRWLVYVGGFSPHKNLESLLRVFARLVASPAAADLRLVMVGEYEREQFHSHFGALRDLAAALGITERVIFTGFLPDEELVHLLNLASALALPSLIEGLGLPAVEAAACGCPVVATCESPLPDLLGAGGRYVDPADPAALEAALAAILSDGGLRREMGAAAAAAARHLTWEAAAARTKHVLDKVGSA